ncbi:MAG: hypothetical protein MUC96_19925 [Myxococcaceae bacterium]|jgi:hypothetical protein|nr:hypothetical protein [Myxococcaceae bacterium]
MRALRAGLLASLAVGLTWCGRPADPELVMRPTGALGPTRTDAGTVVSLNEVPDASVSFFDAGTCCEVPVAIAVQGDETVAYAVEFPSGRRVALQKSGGAWRGSLCFWLFEPVSRYSFQLGYSLADPDADGGTADAGEFLTDFVNRAAPTEGAAAVGEVNVFTPGAAASCSSLDAGVHAQVFEVDAGP